MKLLRYLRFPLLVACCLMLVCSAHGQLIERAKNTGEIDKLGLTPDQKSKIDAIIKSSREQQYAISDEINEATKKLFSKDTPEGRRALKQRLAKQRQIKDNTDAKVNAVLTPDQQRKLRELMYPKSQWSVSGFIFTDKDLSHYKVRLDSYPPPAYLSYAIQSSDIRLSLFDAAGKQVSDGPRLALAPDVPDIIRPAEDDNGEEHVNLAFVFDRKKAKPGVYEIELTAAVEANDVQVHEPVKIRDMHARSYLRLYLTPQPDVEPTLKQGQRFIGTPWEETSASTDTAYKDVKSGKPIRWREIATKILTLERVDPKVKSNKLTFTLEGHQGQVYLETNQHVADLPYLTPLVTEPTVRNLKAQYEGKQVWCYGRAGGQCVSTEPGMSISLSGKADVPMCIRHLERVYLPQKEMAIGMATFMGGERQSAFVTDNPLVVILDASSKGLEFGGFMYSGKPGAKDVEDMSMNEVSNPRAHCLGLWNMVSDRWDFEREYSLQNPLTIGRKWPAKMRKAVLAGKTVKGMTREMVAWVMGWPGKYGTKSEILCLDDWPYDNIPFPGHIYFKNGRMISEDWPSLP